MFRLKFLLRGLFFLIGIVAWQTQENPLEFDTPVEAVFEAGDIHQWQFEAYRDDVITLTLTRTDGELIPILSLLDNQNQIQAQLQGSSDGSAALTYRIPRFGQYIVQIAGEAEGSYTLTLSLAESGRRDFEQGTVEYGQPVIQQLDESIPYHLWTFNGTTGQVVDINVEVLEGDLQPIIALTSPGGINLGRAEGDKNVRLLAVRLPGNGAYEILVRRQGDNLGFSGTTTGRYRLEVTLRNGPEATTNTLVVDELTSGRLTLDSPLARYSVEAIGTFMAEVELSRPNCLVDLNISSGGIVQRAISESPLRFPVEFISTLPHTLEIASANCPNTDRMDFVLRLRPLNADLPLEPLPDDRPVYGTSERWVFEATAGDIIRLTARHTDLRQPLEIQIFAPDRNLLFRSTTRAEVEQTLVLSEDGYYVIEVAASQPYLLHKILIGHNNQLFTTLRPAQEQTLDITETTTWRIISTQADSVLTVENPAGEIIRTAHSTTINGPRIDEITLSQPGRYRIKVYSETSQPNLAIIELFDFENLLLQSGKAILNSAADFHRWQLPLKAGDILKLRLENLTVGQPLPSLALLDQTGLYIPPQYQLVDGNTLELVGLLPPQDGIYTVLVNNDSRGGQLTYRLDTDIENGFTQVAPDTITVTTPIEESFLPTMAVLPAEDPLIPALTERDRANLEDAESVSIPNLIRGEILPNERRQIWRLNVVRRQMISLTATSLDNQPAPGLTLLDANGNIVLEHWERQNPVNHLLYRTPTASTYYVVVTEDLAGGIYLLDVNIVPNLDETIPNVRDAVPLDVGIPVTGEFVSREETDSYVFWARLNDRFFLSAYHETGSFVPEIQLIGPRGNEISTAAFEEQIETFSLPETGLYTVNVSASPLDDEARYGRYTLLVSLMEGQVGDENVLDGTVFGTVTRPFEENLWLFRGSMGESISLLVEPLEISAPADLSVALADSDGEIFYFQQAMLSESAVAIRDVMLPRTGLYQVKMSGSTAGRYRLTLNRRYLAAGDHALAYGDTVSGVFTRGNIVDRWLLAGSQGDVLAVALRPMRGDSASVGFELTAPDGTVVGVGIDNNTGAGARTENIVLPATGVYTLLVGTPDFQFSGSLAYDLSVERQNRTARSWGTLIPYNTAVSGIIYADDTRDVWLFEGNQGDRIQINLAGDGVLQPAFSLTTLNPTETVLLSRTGTAAEAARLAEFTLPETGAYAITVSGVSGVTGAYTLNVTALQQTGAVTQPLQSGQTVAGNVKSGESQIWTVEATAGDILNVRVEPIRRSRLAPHISILSPTGELLTQVIGDSGAVTGIIPYTLPVNGTYWIVVQPAASQDTQGHYEITMELRENGLVEASLLTYEDAGISALSDETPLNTWFFEGQAGDVIRLEVLGTTDDLDTTLKLYDPAGQLMAAADDSPSSTDSEITLTLPQTGRYLVEIARFGGESGFTEGNYRLDLVLLYRPGHITAQPDEYLTYGERVVSRVLPELGAPQTWYFVGKTGDEITAHLQFPAGNIPLVLSLLDSSGGLLQEGERGRERTSIQNFRLPAEGIYQLRIQATRRISSGDYIPYSLSLDLLAGPGESQGGFIQAGTSAAGSFENGENAHLWLYQGQAGEQILLSVLRLAGLALPDVTVFTPDGRILLNLAGSTDRNTHSALLTLPESGLYQMAVVNANADPFLNYRLAVNSGQTNPVAGQLIPGQVEFGYLSDSESAQTWLLDGQAGQRIVIQAAGALDFSIRLDNAAGATLATSQFDSTTGQVILPSVILPAEETYQVVVMREGGILGSEQGSYRIRVSAALTVPEALLAVPLTETMTGSASPSQKAYYLFYADANTPLSLEFLPVSGEAAPDIRILDESGQLVTQSTGTIENFTVNQTGYYIVEIASPTPLSFNLTFAQRSRPTEETVIPLQHSVTTVGDLTRENPVNYWAIDAEAGESLLFEVKVFTNALQADMVLFDPDGLPIQTLIAQDDETLFGPIFIPRDGTYILRMGTWLNLLSVEESSYSVRVRDSNEGAGSQGGSIPQMGQPVFGGISESDPQDIWTFEAQAGSQLSLILRSREGDAELSLSLFLPDGTPFEFETIANGDSLTSDEIGVPITGIYTLEVNLEKINSAAVTSYELVVSETLTPYQNSLANAQGLTLGQPVSGEGASDAWVFFATAGQTITAEIDTPALLTLLSPDGTPRYAGRLENILLLEDGLYSIIVDSPQPYTLLVKTDRMRADWRWSLELGQFEQAVLTSGSPVHEWILTGYHTGEYTISVRPTSPTWQPKTFVVNDTNQVVASGQLQTDGTTLIRLFLDSTDEQTYSLLVAGDISGGTYQVLFDAGVNRVTPEPIQAGIPVTGRIHAFNTADEWLWQGSPSQPLSLYAERLDGNFTMSIRIYAPGNLFLQEFFADDSGQIHTENILLPVEGTYIIQVVRTEDVLSSAQGVYQLQVD